MVPSYRPALTEWIMTLLLRPSSLVYRVVAIVAVAIVLLSPCGWLGRPVASAPLPGLAIPSTPAGERLSWVLGAVNRGGEGLTEGAIRHRFTEAYLSALPPAALIADVVTYLVPIAPISVARIEGGITDTRAHVLLLGAGGQVWRFVLEVEPVQPHRITTLYFLPVTVAVPSPKAPRTWSSLIKRLQRLAPEVSFVAAEVRDATCQPVAVVNPDLPLAIASSFKLYVLGEIARQVASGEARWDEPLTLRNALKSLPSGNLLYLPDGSVLPLQYYAERMIAESDNTATDHLIHRLGRRNVEEMMAVMGHAEPERNRPLLLTREWFAIKLRLRPDQVRRYLAANETGKRKMLRQEIDPLADTLWDGEDWPGPYLIDTIEWFASANDLCRAMVSLHEMASQPGLAPVAGALSLEPGIVFDPAIWTYVGHKSGYETGVKSNAWLLERSDGRWFVLAGIINDPRKEINGAGFADLMVAAAALLAKIP